MKIWKFIFLLAVFCCILVPNTWAAVPFSTPGTFDLAGSTMSFDASIETPLFGSLQVSTNPDPAPLTGEIHINQLNPLTGILSGSFENITASTSAEVSRIGLDFSMSVTINGNPVTGMFIWNQDKVVLYPESLTATLSISSYDYPVQFTGIPLPASYKDGLLTLQTDINYSDTYLGYDYSIQIGINIVGQLQSQDATVTWFNIMTDKNTYFAGDNLKLYANLEYFGPSQRVDFYLALRDPNGTYYFAPTYSTTLRPYVSFMLPSDLALPPTAIVKVTLPAGTPPVSSSGDYQFVAGFCEEGTFTLVGNAAFAEFSYYSSPADPGLTPGPYDGVWLGSGSSTVVSVDCPGFATVHLEIADSQITGWAESDIGDEYMVSGSVDAGGNILNGIILEEIGGSPVPVGTYNGTFSGNTGSGTWMDDYGCYGPFSVNRTP